MLPLLCPVYDCLAAVEVGSSHVAARLLSLTPMMACASGSRLLASFLMQLIMIDCKIVVALAGGR